MVVFNVEQLQELLKAKLESRLHRLEQRNLEEMKDLKLEKASYEKQGELLKKLCSIKIVPKQSKTMTKSKTTGNFRDKSAQPLRNRFKKKENSMERNKSRIKTPINSRNIKTKKLLTNIKTSNTTSNFNTNRTAHNTQRGKSEKKDSVPSYMKGTKANENKKKPEIKNFYYNLRAQKEEKSEDHSVDKIIKGYTEKKKDISRSNSPDSFAKERDSRISRPSRVKQSLRSNNSDIKLSRLSKLNNNKDKDKSVRVSYLEVDEINPNKNSLLNEEVIESVAITNNAIKAEEPREFIMSSKGSEVFKLLCSYLDKQSEFNLLMMNKGTIRLYANKLKEKIQNFLTLNNIDPPNTVQDMINQLKLKYPKEEFEKELPPFELTKGSVKAIELLNNEMYNRIFLTKKLKEPKNEVIIVYRVFFMLLNIKELCDIKDDNEFWDKTTDYIMNNNNGKTGDFFRDNASNFDFSFDNIYKIRRYILGKEKKLSPTFFSKICNTTGLVIFIIKDTFEYIGVFPNEKKNAKKLMLGYYEKLDEFEKKIRDFINKIEEL